MGLGGLTVCGIAVTAAVALVVLQNRHAAALALLAPAATLAVEKLLKPLVARRVPGATTFHYPSGHMAVATTLALSLVLIMHAARVRPMVRNAAAVFMGLLVLLMAVALLVQTAHLLSDVVGGVTTGAAVTLAAALALESRPSATLGARAER
jgi:membrane-associated phospholipid phosphatase